MTYKIGLGHDLLVGALAVIVPQPATVGWQYGRRSLAASGAIYDELPFVEFEFSMLETVAEYQALLTQCGLTTAKTALVTVYLQDENFDFVLRNGTVVKPQIGNDGSRNNYFLRSFVFLVHSLRSQA